MISHELLGDIGIRLAHPNAFRERIPPTPPTRNGTGEAGQPSEPPEMTETEFFWALHEQTKLEISDLNTEPVIMRFLDEMAKHYPDLYGSGPNDPVEMKKLKEFMSRARAEGLLPPLSLRERILEFLTR